MCSFEDFLEHISPIPPIQEDPSDVKIVKSKHDGTSDCLECLLCGTVSGTLKLLSHSVSCKYHQTQVSGPCEFGSIVSRNEVLEVENFGMVLQGEYGSIDKHSSTKSIGSFGASSCLILCLRDRVTTKTILGHIDASSQSPLCFFKTIPPENCDVYAVGGDMSSQKRIWEILTGLKTSGYVLKYGCVLNDVNQAFAINCETGDVCTSSSISSVPFADREKRLDQMEARVKCKMLANLLASLRPSGMSTLPSMDQVFLS